MVKVYRVQKKEVKAPVDRTDAVLQRALKLKPKSTRQEEVDVDVREDGQGLLSFNANIHKLKFDITDVKTEAMWLDNEIAAEWLDKFMFRDQRRPRQNNIATLHQAMEQDALVPCTQIYFCILNNAWYLVDGQHRLQALRASNKPQLFIVTKLYVRSIEDVRAIYYRLDAGAPRSMDDIIQASGFDERFPDLNRQQLAKIATMVRYVYRQGSNGHERASKDAIMLKVAEVTDQAAQYFQAIAGCSRQMLNRLTMAPVMRVGITAFDERPDAAAAFFRVAALGSTESDVRTKLHKLLNDSDPRNAKKAGNGLLLEDKVKRFWEQFLRTYKPNRRADKVLEGASV